MRSAEQVQLNCLTRFLARQKLGSAVVLLLLLLLLVVVVVVVVKLVRVLHMLPTHILDGSWDSKKRRPALGQMKETKLV